MIFITESGKEIQVPNDYTYMSVEKFAKEIYQQGRADAYIECMRIVSECVWKDSDMLEKMISEQLKQQK